MTPPSIPGSGGYGTLSATETDNEQRPEEA